MGGRAKILVADDDLSVLEAIELMLIGEYVVFTARNGVEALEKYDLLNPDLVILDIAMPIVDGIEVAQRIKKRDPEVLIVGVSAYADKLGEEFLRAGAIALLEKPFKKEDLLKLVEDVLSKRAVRLAAPAAPSPHTTIAH